MSTRATVMAAARTGAVDVINWRYVLMQSSGDQRPRQAHESNRLRPAPTLSRWGWCRETTELRAKQLCAVGSSKAIRTGGSEPSMGDSEHIRVESTTRPVKVFCITIQCQEVVLE